MLFFPDARRNIQGLIPNQRERPRRVHGHRCEHRVDGVLKIAVHKDLFFFPELLVAGNQMQPLLLECRQQTPLQAVILQFDHLVGLFGNFLQLLRRREPRNVPLREICEHLVFQGGHADHEEFIQVGTHDAQEFEPLKERNGFIARLIQDAKIELKPREFAAHIVVRICEVQRLLLLSLLFILFLVFSLHTTPLPRLLLCRNTGLMPNTLLNEGIHCSKLRRSRVMSPPKSVATSKLPSSRRRMR